MFKIVLTLKKKKKEVIYATGNGKRIYNSKAVTNY